MSMLLNFAKKMFSFSLFMIFLRSFFLDLIEFLLEIHYSVLNYYFMQPEKCSLTKIL